MSKSILDEIAAKTRERVAEAKRLCPDPMQAAGGAPVLRRSDIPGGKDTRETFSFEKALKAPGLSFICEVKKASPSKGLIAPYFPYTEIARDYDNAGAACISCLTEPFWFKGQNRYLTEIRRVTDIPILRKDFTVDDYMIYEAKALGADAVLLICAILDPSQLKDYIQLADSLGLTAVVEAHDENEIHTAADAGARVIGVNNRNLNDFSVDTKNAGRLRDLVPAGTVFISESGVKTREDVKNAEDMRADAVLVGEALMRAENKGRKLLELAGKPPRVKICGLMRESDVDKVNELHPDYAGFVFAPTRHQVTAAQAAALKKKLDPSIKAGGVFVDADEDFIIRLLKEGVIDYAQLHGNETEDEIERIEKATGKRVVKACVMKGAEDARAEAHFPGADLMLYDAGRGSGRTFNWDYLSRTPARPFFLAGGLTPENVADAVRTVRPFAVDVSSGVEDADLSKNYEKMKAFMEAVRRTAGEE